MELAIYSFVICYKYDMSMLMPFLYKTFSFKIAFLCKFEQDRRMLMCMLYC